jgi:hypothetical protein
MTTQTNGNKGNGDNATHYDAATIANARTYYQKVHEMTRDEAKSKVDDLIKKGQLNDSAFYVGEIAKEAKRQDNLNKRKQAQAEAEERAKQTQEAAKKAREDEEAKKSGVYTLSPEQVSTITLFISQGATRTTIKGYLKDICKLGKEQIEKALNDLMPERAKSVHVGLDDLFHQFLLTGIKTPEEMTTYINEIGSPNFIKVTKVLLKRGEFFNALHRKYGA